MRTAVVALGESGQSRAERHALALARHGDVDLVCGGGSARAPLGGRGVRIQIHPVAAAADSPVGGDGRKRRAPARAIANAYRTSRLFVRLMRLPRPDVILVQTPAASTLPVACLVARLRGARVVVDWQNLPHTLVAVSLGDTHRAVRAVRRRERRWGRRADGHLAASRALADWLQREYRIRADVVYDRPVRAQAEGSRDDVRGRLCRTLGIEAARLPLVLVSTSAGHNDFDMLIEALERAERHLASGDAARTGAAPADRSNEPALTNGPRAMVWIAGHGAGMDAFARRLQRRSFTALAVRTVSIDSGDAAAAAAAADLGLCVHQSSSGLDLPISLADFRGAGVPVCAFDYAPVLGEVLNEGREGLAFRDAGRLAALLVDAARGSSEAGGPIERSRAWLAANPPDWWEDHWERQARPTLDGK